MYPMHSKLLTTMHHFVLSKAMCNVTYSQALSALTSALSIWSPSVLLGAHNVRALKLPKQGETNRNSNLQQ